MTICLQADSLISLSQSLCCVAATSSMSLVINSNVILVIRPYRRHNTAAMHVEKCNLFAYHYSCSQEADQVHTTVQCTRCEIQFCSTEVSKPDGWERAGIPNFLRYTYHTMLQPQEFKNV